MLRKFLFLSFFVVFASNIWAQNPKLDQLEMLYAQNHYKMVYRKANRLLNTPDFDYSQVPAFYKGIAILRIAQRDKDFKKKKYSIDLAEEILKNVLRSETGPAIFQAHIDELANLKQDLLAWAGEEKSANNNEKHSHILSVTNDLFSFIKNPPKEQNSDKNDVVVSENDLSTERVDLLKYAEKFIGTKYVYGGTTPKGFDCSGFTDYVFQSQDINLPRVSNDQYLQAKKVKEKSVVPGDLVFFSSGGKVTHVGIVYSVEDGKIFMIHASSSKGVTITNIIDNGYWEKRIKGFGTYIK